MAARPLHVIEQREQRMNVSVVVVEGVVADPISGQEVPSVDRTAAIVRHLPVCLGHREVPERNEMAHVRRVVGHVDHHPEPTAPRLGWTTGARADPSHRERSIGLPRSAEKRRLERDGGGDRAVRGVIEPIVLVERLELGGFGRLVVDVLTVVADHEQAASAALEPVATPGSDIYRASYSPYAETEVR